MENSLYSNTWFDSDLDSYLLYLDTFIYSCEKEADQELMTFEDFRESIYIKA